MGKLIDKMKNTKDMHKTTMDPIQRQELIRILKSWHAIEILATKTDPELHELWLVDCEHPNPYKDE